MKLNVDMERLEKKARVAELASKLTWLRVPEAAAYANMGESKMWELISQRLIASSKDEGGVVINRLDIDKYYKLRRRALTSEQSG
jgi:hypothetical protein